MYLAEKYSKHLYLKGYSALDKNNEFLRYPDNISFENLINDEEKIDFDEIGKDSEKLFKIISMILFSHSNILTNR